MENYQGAEVNFLKNIKISKKVFGGFGIVLLLLSVMAVIAVLSLTTADDNFTRYREIALQSNQAGRVQANMLEARLAVRIYQSEPTTEVADDAIERLEATAALNTELRSLVDEPEKIEAIERSSRNIASYFKGVRDMIAAKDPVITERISSETLNVIGPKITTEMEDFKLLIKAEQDELGPRAAAEIENGALITEVLVVVVIFLGSVAAWLIGTGISRPIVSITASMRTLANGDKTILIPGQDHKDEIGEMAKAVLVFKENMIKAEELAAQEAEAQKRREERAKLIEKLTNDFDDDVSTVLKTVASAATEMQATATSMTATAEETSRQSTVVAAAAEQASNNVQTVASASEELSASISEISQQVSQSAQVAIRAVNEAESTNIQVRGLAEAAQKIGDVVGLISDIAAQTNLLALNATIEAARAGEAGKGFAVVAAEVKNLANATSKATEEITTQITAIQGETDSAVVAIDSIGRTIAEISEIAATIASAVEQQGAATEEINRNVQEASTGTNEVTENIHGVNEAAASTGAAADQVLAASGDLSEQAETLRHKVEAFLSAVKAA
ncbi:methyl-accepting chemotaxis protein [Thalassospira australica]|uniref:methyl-accepting chemotaxis protein n=1 Tax=Thalassospira australica TaxID=1528106 RepID=UPI00384A761E